MKTGFARKQRSPEPEAQEKNLWVPELETREERRGWFAAVRELLESRSRSDYLIHTVSVVHSWRRDAFRHWMARRMYFETGTLKRLVDVDPGFDIPELDAGVAGFREELRRLDRELPRRYIPLEEIASSIQF